MKLGVLVPYRNREEHLNVFLPHIEIYLSNQNIDYEIIISEQSQDSPFNRGMLLNIAFLKAKEYKCDYIVLHDIDMLPIDADYSYPEFPKHMITDLQLPPKVDRVMEEYYFGGATIFSTKHFELVNGFSNNYWGWGFEDDDLRLRCQEKNILNNNYRRKGQFKTLSHKENGQFTQYETFLAEYKFKLIEQNKLTNLEKDGITTIPFNYKTIIKNKKFTHLYTTVKYNKIGICVPYRDRENHLNQFLPNIINYLIDKNINFKIYVVNQDDNKPLNRGALKNIAVKYALRDNCNYVAFHDIDMLVENADYSYVKYPTRIATKFNPKMDKYGYKNYFGGVVLLNREHLVKTNGYSNGYWGWGAEDDDLFFRCKFNNLIDKDQPFIKSGIFKVLYHPNSYDSEKFHQDLYHDNLIKLDKMIEGKTNYKNDGLNNINFIENSLAYPNPFTIFISIKLIDND